MSSRVRPFMDVDEQRLASVRFDELAFLDAVRQWIFVPLGQEAVDFSAVLVELESCGYDGWTTVEHDRVPDSSAVPAEKGRQRLEYLPSLTQ